MVGDRQQGQRETSIILLPGVYASMCVLCMCMCVSVSMCVSVCLCPGVRMHVCRSTCTNGTPTFVPVGPQKKGRDAHLPLPGAPSTPVPPPSHPQGRGSGSPSTPAHPPHSDPARPPWHWCHSWREYTAVQPATATTGTPVTAAAAATTATPFQCGMLSLVPASVCVRLIIMHINMHFVTTMYCTQTQHTAAAVSSKILTHGLCTILIRMTTSWEAHIARERLAVCSPCGWGWWLLCPCYLCVSGVWVWGCSCLCGCGGQGGPSLSACCFVPASSCSSLGCGFTHK